MRGLLWIVAVGGLRMGGTPFIGGEGGDAPLLAGGYVPLAG
jgi:hypothetical protein